MYTVCAFLLWVFSEVPLVGGSGGGEGSWLTAPICCSWPASKDSKQAGEREREREMIRLLAVHAARGGWLNTTAGVTN